MEETPSTLMTLLRTPSVIGLLLMFAIIFNILWMIWCTKAYEDPYFVLDTKMKINALWRDYTPCGILSMWSGKRPRGWTRGEALHALTVRRAANRRAEAKALALARANYWKQKPPHPILKHTTEAALRKVNKTNKITKHRATQEAKKTNIYKKNVRFMIDDYDKIQEFSESIKTPKTQAFSGSIKTPKTSSTVEASTSDRNREIGNTCYRRTSFRKINVTYKRPLPPLPAYTIEDRTVKIVISDIYDRYEILKSESNQGPSHRYEYINEKESRGGAQNHLKLQDDFYEPVGPGPRHFPYTEELEVFV